MAPITYHFLGGGYIIVRWELYPKIVLNRVEKIELDWASRSSRKWGLKI